MSKKYRTTLDFDLIAARKAQICASALGISHAAYVRRAVNLAIARDIGEALAILNARDSSD